MIESAKTALLGGRAVSLVHIGTIEPYDKKPSSYRDPVTKEIQAVPGRRHLKFTLSVGLKALLRDTALRARWEAHWSARFDALERQRAKHADIRKAEAKTAREAPKVKPKRSGLDAGARTARLKAAAKPRG